MTTDPVGTILVVDDEADLRELLRFRITEAGFEVITAATAAEALAAAARRRPQVVVLDWMLPDMPGTEVCRRLRAAPATRDVPILMLTARGDEVDRVVEDAAGAPVQMEAMTFFMTSRKLGKELGKQCLAQAGKARSAMARLTLAADGKVTASALLLEEGSSPALRSCLKKALATLTLPKPPMGMKEHALTIDLTEKP